MAGKGGGLGKNGGMKAVSFKTKMLRATSYSEKSALGEKRREQAAKFWGRSFSRQQRIGAVAARSTGAKRAELLNRKEAQLSNVTRRHYKIAEDYRN